MDDFLTAAKTFLVDFSSVTLLKYQCSSDSKLVSPVYKQKDFLIKLLKMFNYQVFFLKKASSCFLFLSPTVPNVTFPSTMQSIF